MKEVGDLEEKVWSLIKNAMENRDSQKIHQLNSIAQDIERIKQDAKRVQDAIVRVENLGVTSNVTASTKSVSWKITEGAIKQNYLSTTEAARAELIPSDGQPFEVETSVGQVFKTDVLRNYNRLRERGKIREFYEKAGIRAGDRVVWSEIGPYRYRLSKVS